MRIRVSGVGKKGEKKTQKPKVKIHERMKSQKLRMRKGKYGYDMV
jgi:hypothetical protein